MAYDPVHQGQLYIRRAGHLLRNSGVLPLPECKNAPLSLEGEARERFFETGVKQTARVAEVIQEHTGCSLEGRRGLDFGCGVGRLVMPLSERCEYVYGVDVSTDALRQADVNAKRMGRSNVEWLETARLEELSGKYDLVVSTFVFQHIPSREGERIFSTLLRGLRPGGVGALHMALRPSHPVAGLFHSTRKPGKSPYNPVNVIRGLDISYPYMLMHSYSLNRLGRLLADQGISDWHARWDARIMPENSRQSFEAVNIVFRKG